METKLTLSESQTECVYKACDLYSRICIGEFHHLLTAYQTNLSPMDFNFCLELLLLVEERCTKKPRHCYPSVQNQALVGENARIAKDISAAISGTTKSPVSQDGYPTIEVIESNVEQRR